jgi:hypothetical protein
MQVNNVSFTGLYKAVPHHKAVVYDSRVKSNVEARVFEYRPFKDETDSQISTRKNRYDNKIFAERVDTMFAPCGEGRFVKYIKPVVILGERLPVTNDEYIQMCMCKNVPLQDSEHTFFERVV